MPPGQRKDANHKSLLPVLATQLKFLVMLILLKISSVIALTRFSMHERILFFWRKLPESAMESRCFIFRIMPHITRTKTTGSGLRIIRAGLKFTIFRRILRSLMLQSVCGTIRELPEPTINTSLQNLHC